MQVFWRGFQIRFPDKNSCMIKKNTERNYGGRSNTYLWFFFFKNKLPRGVVEGGPIRIFGINLRPTVQQQLITRKKKKSAVSFRTMSTTKNLSTT